MGGSSEILMFYGLRIIPYIYGLPLTVFVSGKNRQLAKLLSGFVTGQITVAKVVVTVAAQSLAWGK